jgi:uncharacterized protein DUF3261
VKAAIVALGAGFALASCSRAPARRPEYPAAEPLLAPSAHAADFLDRQKIVATYGDRSLSFEAVLQKRGDELTLLGLTPFGSRAFLIVLRGTDMSFEKFVPQTLPFSPRYILLDVQRVFYPWIDGPSGPSSPEGERRGDRDGESIEEHWHDGRLLRRSFRRADGHPRAEVVVTYDGGMSSDASPPSHAVLANERYGYRLDITTLSHQSLEPRRGDAADAG